MSKKRAVINKGANSQDASKFIEKYSQSLPNIQTFFPSKNSPYDKKSPKESIIDLLGSTLEVNIRNSFISAFKKSHQTRIKALKAIEVFFHETPLDEALSVMPIWNENLEEKILVYKIHNFIVHEKGSILNDYVDQLIISWVLATHDYNQAFSSIAIHSFSFYFDDSILSFSSKKFSPYVNKIVTFLEKQLNSSDPTQSLESSQGIFDYNLALSEDLLCSCVLLSGSLLKAFPSDDPFSQALWNCLFSEKHLIATIKSSERASSMIECCSTLVSVLGQQLSSERHKIIGKFGIRLALSCKSTTQYKLTLDFLSLVASFDNNILLMFELSKSFWSKIWQFASDHHNPRCNITHTWLLSLFEKELIPLKFERCFLSTLQCTDNYFRQIVQKSIKPQSLTVLKLLFLLLKTISQFSNSSKYSSNLISQLKNCFLYSYLFSVNLPEERQSAIKVYFELLINLQKTCFLDDSTQVVNYILNPSYQSFRDFLITICENSGHFLLEDALSWIEFFKQYFSLDRSLLITPKSTNIVDDFIELLSEEALTLVPNVSYTFLCIFLKESALGSDETLSQELVENFIDRLPHDLKPISESPFVVLIESYLKSTNLLLSLCKKLSPIFILSLCQSLIEKKISPDKCCFLCGFLWNSILEDSISYEILNDLILLSLHNLDKLTPLLAKIASDLCRSAPNKLSLIFSVINLILCHSNLDLILTHEQIAILFPFWLQGIDHHSSEFLNINPYNYQILFSTLNNFVTLYDDTSDLSFHLETLLEDFISFTSMNTHLLQNYINFSIFINELVLDFNSLLTLAFQIISSLEYVSHISSFLCVIPNLESTSTLPCLTYDSKGLKNKIGFLLILFKKNFPLFLDTFKDNNEFKDWLCAFLLINYLVDSHSGMIILTKVLQYHDDFFCSSLLASVLNHSRRHSPFCILLLNMLRTGPFNKPEVAMKALTNILSEFDLDDIISKNDKNLFYFICTLMNSLKDPEHIYLLYQYYFTQIKFEHDEPILHYAVLFANLFLAFIRTSKKDQQKITKSYEDMLEFSPHLNKLLTSITCPSQNEFSCLYLQSLYCRISIEFYFMFGNYLLQTSYMVQALNLFHHSLDSLISNISGCSVCCFSEIYLIIWSALRSPVIPYQNPNSLLKFPLIKISFDDFKIDFLKEKSISIINDICSITFKNNNYSRLFTGFRSLQPQSGFSSCCPDLSTVDFYKNLKKLLASNELECFEIYYDLVKNLSIFTYDSFFYQMSTDSNSTLEADSRLLEAIEDSIKGLNSGKFKQNFFTLWYFFETTSIKTQFFCISKACLIALLIFSILKKVPLESEMVVLSCPIVQSLSVLISNLLKKLPLNNPNMYKYNAEFSLKSIYSASQLILFTLISIGSKFPSVLVNCTSKVKGGTVSLIKKFCQIHLCPYLIKSQLNKCQKKIPTNPSTCIKIESSTNQMIITYKLQEESLDLIVYLPPTFPFEPPRIEPVHKAAYRSSHLMKDINKLRLLISAGSGRLVDAFHLWFKTLDGRLTNLECCVICYTILNSEDMSIPNCACAVCRQRCHKKCLAEWFHSSGKTACPLCRSNFY